MKVYLAKSNRCNPSDYMTIRNLLLSHNVEVLEYAGGVYNDVKLLSADMLVVLPESTKSPVILGKGLYMQIAAFGKQFGKNLWIVTDVLNLTVTHINSENLHLHDTLDYAKYSKYIDKNPVPKSLLNLLPSKYEIIL